MIGAVTFPNDDPAPSSPSPNPPVITEASFHEPPTDCKAASKVQTTSATPPLQRQEDMDEEKSATPAGDNEIVGAVVEPQLPPHSSDEETVIAVMGATGSGKTTFINTVSGSQMKTSDALRSCTNAVQLAPSFLLDGRMVTLVDTPGFDDTTRSDTDILKMIAHFLTITYENGKKLGGVIYIHRISDFRMGGISTRNFKMFRELCGDTSLKNVVILTNMWGQVSEEVGQAREHELATDDLFFKPVLEKGARMLRHDKTLESAERTLQSLFETEPSVLQIQRELVDEKKDILQTAAGAELNRELTMQMQRHTKDLAELQEEWQAAMSVRDEETRREIEAEANKLKKEMQRVEDESLKLASSFQKEKEELEKRMIELDAEAKRDQQRLQEQYKEQMEELQRQRLLDSNQSKEKQDQLALQINTLKKRRKGTGWFSMVGRALDNFFGMR